MPDNLNPQAIAKYKQHNDGSLSHAICKCSFCKYVRHMRHIDTYPCPFGGCPQCAPKDQWKE